MVLEVVADVGGGFRRIARADGGGFGVVVDAKFWMNRR